MEKKLAISGFFPFMWIIVNEEFKDWYYNDSLKQCMEMIMKLVKKKKKCLHALMQLASLTLCLSLTTLIPSP